MGPACGNFWKVRSKRIKRKKILFQLVDIVAYAHKHRIMHRDIKPENIVVRRDSVVKLLDYGVAKELKERDISSTMVGSRPFMAPEQISGESQIASDVWALGIVMYAIYTGYLPFYHDNEKILMDLILTIEPRPPREVEPDIPVELERIILTCLKKDPKERFADAGILKATIRETFPQFGKRLLTWLRKNLFSLWTACHNSPNPSFRTRPPKAGEIRNPVKVEYNQTLSGSRLASRSTGLGRDDVLQHSTSKGKELSAESSA